MNASNLFKWEMDCVLDKKLTQLTHVQLNLLLQSLDIQIANYLEGITNYPPDRMRACGIPYRKKLEDMRLQVHCAVERQTGTILRTTCLGCPCLETRDKNDFCFWYDEPCDRKKPCGRDWKEKPKMNQAGMEANFMSMGKRRHHKK